MKRFSILFALVAAACGDSPSANDNKRIDVTLPTPDAAPQVGFGSGAPVGLVENKAAKELPAVEHYIPAKYAECMSLGKSMLDKGEHVRARELFEAAAKLDRKAAMPHVELARSYIATSARALAIRHAAKAVKLAPESSLAYNTLGRAELLRHDYDAAVIAFRQATELDAGNVWAWNNLGLVYMTKKDHVEAVNALLMATEGKGVESYMWNNLGLAYEQLDKLDEARDAFDSGAKLGSVAAKASRKRLDGVDSVRIARKGPKDVGFETREPAPEIEGPNLDELGEQIVDEEPEVIDVVIDETAVEIEESKVEEKMADETTVEEPESESRAEEPKVDEPSSGPNVEPKADTPTVEPKST